MPKSISWRQLFANLAAGFGASLRGAPTGERKNSSPEASFEFSIDGLEFVAIHPEPGSEMFSLDCRFGTFRKRGAADALEKVLQANQLMFHQGAGLFAVDPSNTCLVFRNADSLARLKEKALLESVCKKLASIAEIWQTNLRLETKSPAKG